MISIDKIYNEDCLIGMQSIDDKSIDCIICDLPYGQTQNKWDSIIPFDKLWKQYKRIIKDNGAIILFGNNLFSAHLIISNEEMYRYSLVWQKTTPTGFLNAKRQPMRSHEDILVFYKKQPTYNPQKTSGHTRKVSLARHKSNSKKTTDYGEHEFKSYDSTERYPTSVITFPTDRQKSSIHPTQKPVALIEWLIQTYTNAGDLILDNCIGSGTTAVAALNTGRHFIGFETDTEYFNKANERIYDIRRRTEENK